jgi:uracil-DNA glycosylase family 4
MLKSLENYYKKNGILSTDFHCKYKKQCKGSCPTFTGPKSSFVSSGYAKGKLSRLLFLSLDSCSGNKNILNKTPTAVRENIEKGVIANFSKHKHWYRTHELAYHILKKYSDKIQLENVNKYFAHVNSAKCCQNKPHREKADKVLFRNCRNYLLEEFKILKPDIIVTQGNEAKTALLKYSTILKRFNPFSQIVMLNNKEIFWLHTYHPSNYGSFNKQRNKGKGWELYSKRIYKWYTEK